MPFRHAISITPDDNNDNAKYKGFPTVMVYVGVAGDLKVDLVGGATITIKNAPVGYHPIQVDRVYSTGTAASQILGWYTNK